MSEELDFLDGDKPAETPAAVSEQPVVETPAEPSQEGPARGPDGKFVSKAGEAPQEPQAAPEPPQAPPVEAKAEPAQVPEGYVPLSALKELRKEIQALKQAPPSPIQLPDIYQDPEGYQQAVQFQAEQQAHAIRLDYSKRLAAATHGAQTVDQAYEWAYARCDADPIFNQQVRAAADPYEFVVSEWKRDRIFGLLSQQDPARLEQLLAGLQAPAQHTPQAVQQPPPQQPIPTPSLASAPAAGSDKPGAMPIHEGAAFDAIFR